MNPGVKWKPFEISKQDYDNLIRDLQMQNKDLKICNYPSWIKTVDDWEVFLCELLDGIPSKEHQRLKERVRDAERTRNGVMFKKKKGDLSKLAEKAILANIELDNFTKRYTKENT
jgi:hypothetical protein